MNILNAMSGIHMVRQAWLYKWDLIDKGFNSNTKMYKNTYMYQNSDSVQFSAIPLKIIIQLN